MHLTKTKRIFIILLNWNGWQDTVECLSSLDKVLSLSFQPVVVDNGSTNDSIAEIRALYPKVPIIEAKANLGYAGGNNLGIEWALKKHAEWICLLNNDTIVDPDFLLGFFKTIEQHPEAKLLGGKILSYQNPTTLDHFGGFWNAKTGNFTSPNSGKRDDGSFQTPFIADYACGAALLIHRNVFETIGLLESKFFLFWEESDFCMRAKRKGFSTWMAPEAKIWHKVNSSFVGGKPHSHYFWWRSRLLWIERNCLPEERKLLYRSIIFPEIMRTLKHGLLKSIQLILCPTTHRKEKARLYLAGSLGILHYAFRRFGNCPSFLYKRELQKTRSVPASVKLKSLPLDASNQRKNRHDKLNIALPEAQQK